MITHHPHVTCVVFVGRSAKRGMVTVPPELAANGNEVAAKNRRTRHRSRTNKYRNGFFGFPRCTNSLRVYQTTK